MSRLRLVAVSYLGMRSTPCLKVLRSSGAGFCCNDWLDGSLDAEPRVQEGTRLSSHPPVGLQLVLELILGVRVVKLRAHWRAQTHELLAEKVETCFEIRELDIDSGELDRPCAIRALVT